MNPTRQRLESLLGAPAVIFVESAELGRELPVACPASEPELLETLKLAAKEGWSLVPMGLGSKLSWRGRPQRVDCALSTRRLSGVVAFEPGDGTLTARAGTVMAELDRVAGEGGNHWTPRVAAPDRATLGGVLAAGQSGIDRLRYGPSRHHVLGIRVALADGSVAKSGGRLVKNVTGYDMHRLWCGSHGTLCVILEASMRLFAGFEREILISAPVHGRKEAIERARAIASLHLQPLCVRAENLLEPGGGWRVHVLLAGREAVVEWALRAALEALPGAVKGAETIERIRDLELASGRWPDLHVSGRPSRLLGAIESSDDRCRMVIDPSIGIADVSVDPEQGERIAREFRTAGLHVCVRGVGAEPVDEESEAGSGIEMMQRLRRAFDPQGVFARGRFPPGV